MAERPALKHASTNPNNRSDVSAVPLHKARLPLRLHLLGLGSKLSGTQQLGNRSDAGRPARRRYRHA
jgi:hypothetical protein